MAKGGAKKKTKWVSLSLASAAGAGAGTGSSAAEQHEAASESSRGTKKSAYSTANPDRLSENALSNDISPAERKSSWHTNGYFRSPTTDGQPYSNGYRTHPSRNYSTHFKSHYNKSSYYHNGSSRRPPHYNSYSDRSRPHNVNEPKSEQNGAVIINEEEYTKITTPRQDVLFKKGYLSRPKNYTTTSTMNANESGTATGSSSLNGTTTDGSSDAAIGSGTVSTAESVTSDSTYLTDGHLLDYPVPLPYFGYIDQSGVLVMNGFAIDNSGFSYMNGGQTYIYPPNYHCPSSFSEEGQPENAEEPDSAAMNGDDQTQPPELLNGVISSENPIHGLDTVDSDARFDSISEETVEALVTEENEGADSNQQVPQQSMLSPLESSYDYAQFYNPFFYPGCMVAPFPVVGGEMYYDQFGGVGEEEQARDQSFRRRKKRYRPWDEYPHTFYPDGTVDAMYQYSNDSNISENGIPNLTEVPADFAVVSESNSNDRTVPTLPPITENIDTTSNQTTNELPSSHQAADQCASPSRSSKPPPNIPLKASEDRSHLNAAVSAPTGKPRSHVQKPRKKDLIEMTRAFAEQNIDLSRPVSLYKPAEDNASEWKTVRNGKEVAVREDREVVGKDTIKKGVEGDAESIKKEKLFFDDCKPDQTVVSDETTRRSKKEVTSKKGKKTAKGKGKKVKKHGVLNQQTGFEVIEPEFIVDKKDFSQTRNEETPAVSHEDLDEVDEEDQGIMDVELGGVQNLNSNEVESISSTLLVENGVDDGDNEYDEERLENDLHDIQLSDLQIEECCQENEDSQKNVEKEEEIIYPESLTSETNNISEELIEEQIIPQIEVNVETHENFEEHEVLLESTKVDKIEEATPSQESVEKGDLIEAVHRAESTAVGQLEDHELDAEEEEQKCKHFSNDEYSDEFDSGVQSPAAFTSASSDCKDRKSSSSSIGSQDIHLTDAVTKWLSETLTNKRLEELFVLPEDPLLLHRIHQFNILNFDESLVLSSDTYSSSSEDEGVDSVDSDYMSDVQVKNRVLNGGPEGQQKTELKKDQLAKQTANGRRLMNGGDHSNHKQKRCIIM